MLNFLRRIKQRIMDNRILCYDEKMYSRYYATSDLSVKKGIRSARDILVFSHVVEKGLSHKKIKPLFGYDRVRIIEKSLNDYLQKGGSDSYIISTGISALQHYNEANRILGVSEDKLIAVPDVGVQHIDIGSVELTKEEAFPFEKGVFETFCKTRHSLRLYDCKSDIIDDSIIEKAVKIAQTAPSACNRQSTRVRIVKDDAKARKILSIQGGTNGFGDNAGAVLIISSDISLYEPSERRLPMIDAGIFIMNLVYALHDNHVGTCILNGSFTLDREKKMQEIVRLPSNEMYCSVIALSSIPQNEKVLVAKSSKRPVESIIKYVV